tara:strand:+ start:1603 stop:2421 length:819 start_codon:yes stop_codon:yes gene_type:complete
MKFTLTILFFFVYQFGLPQQYDSVFIEEEDIDSNNKTYKIGNVYIFDYEIIQSGEKYKLIQSKGMFKNRVFELAPFSADTIGLLQIHLIVKPVEDIERTNSNQTQISYLESPYFESSSSTGVVDNDKNVWIHPIRNGFFNSLETCPFPYVKLPLEIGSEWSDAMLIGEPWGDEKWGKWDGQLLLNYNYKITGKSSIKTKIGQIECYVIESTAVSEIGETKLKSYFSTEFGFVRLEYNLINDLNINFWLSDFMVGKEFNDTRTFFKTKEYIKH